MSRAKEQSIQFWDDPDPIDNHCDGGLPSLIDCLFFNYAIYIITDKAAIQSTNMLFHFRDTEFGVSSSVSARSLKLSNAGPGP